ncbi:class I SAM-dependent DNA methyltransferase [Ornithinibacillus californiensis]|uniref:class I SAM-dependent DNA methyltransferase n=1 Tax=Ornithinibacillus californiensis TaxID=161536 RepID=UPI00064D849E|nr:class I SAM-dependent methyltransferase [Ornithinibacillus californiensis]
MAYQLMAGLYDQFMGDAPYDQWVKLTERIIKQYDLKTPRIIDLGCGTGEITIKLAKNYSITGIDYSSDMLTIAEQKASVKNLKIDWVHQDLVDLEGLVGFDVAISYCDVINYITSIESLQKVFTNVAKALNENGILVFDIHSVKHVEEELVGNTFSDVTESSAYIWNCFPGDHEGEMFHELTFFQKNGESYSRFDETHHQQTFAVHVYKELLNNAGLEILNIHADFLLENNFSESNAERIFIIAQKRTR